MTRTHKTGHYLSSSALNNIETLCKKNEIRVVLQFCYQTGPKHFTEADWDFVMLQLPLAYSYVKRDIKLYYFVAKYVRDNTGNNRATHRAITARSILTTIDRIRSEFKQKRYEKRRNNNTGTEG